MSLPDSYSLQTAPLIISGGESLRRLGEVVKAKGGDSVVIITDSGVWEAGLIARPKRILENLGVKVEIINTVPPEPEIGQVKSIFEKVKALVCDMLIGIGGGSVMDVTKLLSVMLTNATPIEEMIGTDRIKNNGIPTLMLPTTAGTGSEVTPNAIVTLPEEELKVGIVSSKLIPSCVILDPELTVKLPPSITAATGMDAFIHALECFISKKANPFSDTFALKAISLIYKSIRKAYTDGEDLEARHDMLLGALFGGMCIASSGTAAVHALAYPLGGKYKIPHGVANAMLLPYVMEYNMEAVEEKLAIVASAMELDIVGLSEKEAAGKVVEEIYVLTKDLNIPSDLKQFGVLAEDVELISEMASKVTRLLDNNPRKLSREDIRDIYQRLM